ncbi:MAG: hypothetical protein QMC90_05720, partial [Dehalococcoidales bacterium]|nr:hypothetical protein [Dehalococcoidales bacterium]
MKKWVKIVIPVVLVALVASSSLPVLAQEKEGSKPPPFEWEEQREKIQEIVTLNLNTAHLLAQKANELATKTGITTEELIKAGEMAQQSMKITYYACHTQFWSWPWLAPEKWKEWMEEKGFPPPVPEKWKEWMEKEGFPPPVPEKPKKSW